MPVRELTIDAYQRDWVIVNLRGLKLRITRFCVPVAKRCDWYIGVRIWRMAWIWRNGKLVSSRGRLGWRRAG